MVGHLLEDSGWGVKKKKKKNVTGRFWGDGEEDGRAFSFDHPV